MQLTMIRVSMVMPVRPSMHLDERVRDNVSASRVPSSATHATDNAADARHSAPQVDDRDNRLKRLFNLHVSVGDVWVVSAYVDSVAVTEPSLIEVTSIQADGMVEGALLVRSSARSLVPVMRQVDDMRLPTCTVVRVWQQSDYTCKPVCPNPLAPSRKVHLHCFAYFIAPPLYKLRLKLHHKENPILVVLVHSRNTL